ncbi:MAG: ferrochelatase [Burkholderiaceae bacterium]
MPPRTAILLVNLGTPDAPTPSAVRRYLAEFLWDPRVVEIPRVIWWPILFGIILPIRSRRSAEKYKAVWMQEGSPLKVWTEKQAKLLRGLMGMRGHALTVEYAMRYGNPSLADALDRLHAQACERILVLPLYPQYSATTTASSFDAINAWAAKVRNVPEFRFVKQYHDDAGYIDALASTIVTARTRDGTIADSAAVLVMSFHGIPQRSVRLGDPYQAQCLVTAERVAERLGLRKDQWVATFQSRFGRAEWLKPYTVDVLQELGAKRTSRLDICCPGFPADCLETLEEIGIEGEASFKNAGGGSYRYISCVNDNPRWIAALAAIAERNLQGWL